MRVRKRIFYFPSLKEAKTYAETVGVKEPRLILYELGWAIQIRKSGPYIGLDNDWRQDTSTIN